MGASSAGTQPLARRVLLPNVVVVFFLNTGKKSAVMKPGRSRAHVGFAEGKRFKSIPGISL